MVLPQDISSEDLTSVTTILTVVFGLVSTILGYLVKSFRDSIKDKDRQIAKLENLSTKKDIEVEKHKAMREAAEQQVSFLKMMQTNR